MKNSLAIWIVLMMAIRQSTSHIQRVCTVASLFTGKHDNFEKELTNHSAPSPKARKKPAKYSIKIMMDLINILNEQSGETSTRPKRDLYPLTNELTEDSILKAEISDDIISMSCINNKADIMGKKQKLVFSMKEISDNFEVIGAELKLYQKKVPTSTSYLLKVFQRPQNPKEGKKMKKATQKNISADFTGWITIDVSQVFKDWLKNQSKNQTLYITTQRDGEIFHPATTGIVFQNQEHEPFLLAFLQSNEAANIRIPRYLLAPKTKDLSTDNNETSESKCRLRPMEVSFKDLGWHKWVIAPDKFTTGYCEGSCDFPLKSPTQATNHAIIQSMMALKYPDQFPKPLCAPYETSSLSVLFNVDSNTILKTYSKMIVKSCSCQ